MQHPTISYHCQFDIFPSHAVFINVIGVGTARQGGHWHSASVHPLLGRMAQGQRTTLGSQLRDCVGETHPLLAHTHHSAHTSVQTSTHADTYTHIVLYWGWHGARLGGGTRAPLHPLLEPRRMQAQGQHTTPSEIWSPPAGPCSSCPLAARAARDVVALLCLASAGSSQLSRYPRRNP